MKPTDEELERMADNIVSGFFIGGSDDDLQQPNLTKSDLNFAIKETLRKVRDTARAEVFEECANLLEGSSCHDHCSEECDCGNPCKFIANLIRDRAKEGEGGV